MVVGDGALLLSRPRMTYCGLGWGLLDSSRHFAYLMGQMRLGSRRVRVKHAGAVRIVANLPLAGAPLCTNERRRQRRRLELVANADAGEQLVAVARGRLGVDCRHGALAR